MLPQLYFHVFFNLFKTNIAEIYYSAVCFKAVLNFIFSIFENGRSLQIYYSLKTVCVLKNHLIICVRALNYKGRCKTLGIFACKPRVKTCVQTHALKGCLAALNILVLEDKTFMMICEYRKRSSCAYLAFLMGRSTAKNKIKSQYQI